MKCNKFDFFIRILYHRQFESTAWFNTCHISIFRVKIAKRN